MTLPRLVCIVQVVCLAWQVVSLPFASINVTYFGFLLLFWYVIFIENDDDF